MMLRDTPFSWFLIILVTLTLFAGEVHAADSESSATSDWPLSRGDAAATGWSPVTLPDNLSQRWQFEASDAVEAAPVVQGDTVFVGDVAGKVFAIDLESGEERWQRDVETGFVASPAVQGHRLVVGDFDGNVFCLAVSDGSVLWQQTTEGEVSASAGFHGENVLVTSQDGSLYCFAVKDGSLVWTYQTNDQVRCGPSIAGDHTFLGGCDAQLHAVDLKTGQDSGETMPLDGPTGSTPAIAGDQAIVPIMDGIVIAFDWRKREELWRYDDADQRQEYRSSAAVDRQFVVVASQRRQVDALDLNTGERKWRYTLKRRADSSPVIAGDDVWLTATDGRIIRLDRVSGKLKWEYEVRGGFIGGPAIAGNRLLVADDNGVVRCFAAPGA